MGTDSTPAENFGHRSSFLDISKETDGVCVIAVTGLSEIDAAMADDIGDELMALISEDSVRHLIIDLEEISYLSSRAIGRLVELHNKGAETSRRIIFTGLKEDIKRMLRVMGLDTLFETAADVAEAREALCK